jgi:MtrB/PioB family decaheme-associated outer membrane protein
MKNTKHSFAVRVSVIAVRAALAALAGLAMAPAAYADSEADQVKELTQPSSTVEVGVGDVNNASAKFGEYNGLQKDGAYLIGNFNLRGGAPYDSDSAWRWNVTGRDLGLRTRSLDAEVGNQGSFRVNYGYDELRRNYADDYQTFYNGAGTKTLTLPSSFAATPAAQRSTSAVPTGATLPASAYALSNWQNIQSPYATAACANTALSGGVYGTPTSDACRGPAYLIPAAMHNFDVGTQRYKHNLGVSVIVAPGWEVTASATHELKDGTKLTGVAFGGPARGVLVPEVINSTTDQVRFGLAFTGEKGYFNVGYYGSTYRNSTDLWTVENPFNGSLLNSTFANNAKLIGAPDNESHRFSLAGGYNFSPTTRLVVAANHQRMTQNESLVSGLPSTWTIPTTSANAKVINTSLTAALTLRAIKDWALGATYKYENRDNQSPVYNFMVAGGDAAGNPSLFSTEPLNRKMQQINLDAEYAVARRQAVKFGYEFQEIERTADGDETPFAAEKTKENTLRLEYRNSTSDKVTGRVSYAHSQRRHSEYEDNVLLPTPTVAPLPAADPLLPGFQQAYLADRDRDAVRSALNFQVSEAFTLQTGVDYNHDKYKGNEWGMRDTDSWIFKLDGAFVATENLVYNAFYTYEDRQSHLESLVIGRGSTATILDAAAHKDPCAGYFAAAGHLPSDEGTDSCRAWSEKQNDRVHTFGFGAKAANLANGKFDFGVDLAYSRARTPIDVAGGAYFGNGNAVASTATPYNNIFIAAQSFPDITSNMLDLRLNGVYKLNKAASVRISYLYRRLQSNDWQYDAYANSALGVLAVPVYPGVGMTSPNYNVQAIGVTYIYTFR